MGNKGSSSVFWGGKMNKTALTACQPWQLTAVELKGGLWGPKAKTVVIKLKLLQIYCMQNAVCDVKTHWTLRQEDQMMLIFLLWQQQAQDTGHFHFFTVCSIYNDLVNCVDHMNPLKAYEGVVYLHNALFRWETIVKFSPSLRLFPLQLWGPCSAFQGAAGSL